MYGFDTLLIAMFVNIAIALLQPKPEIPGAKKYGLSEFEVATATEDRAKTIPFGTCRLAGNVIWYGDYQADAVTEKVKVNMFSSTTVTKAWAYRMGIWISLAGAPCDSISEIRLGEQVVWSGNLALSKTAVTVLDVNTRFTQQEGQDVAGGMVGRFVFFNQRARPGDAYTPLANPYAEGMLGAGDVPAYPNTLHVLWLGPTAAAEAYLGAVIADAIKQLLGFAGTGPNIQPLTFTVSRKPDLAGVLGAFGPGADPGLNVHGDYADVQGDANPAYIELELLTSRIPGLGPRLARNLIDTDSYTAAAQKYHAEGLGMSFAWESSRPINSVLGDLANTCASITSLDEQTGQIRHVPVRSTDVPIMGFDEAESVDEYGDPSYLTELKSFERVNVSQAPNLVEVPFTDRKNGWIDRVVFAKNPAGFKAAGTEIVSRSEFLGVSREAVAQLIATRELRTKASSLAKASWSGWLPVWRTLRPGDLVTLRHRGLGQTLRMRVVSARYGGSGSGWAVDVEAVEDVFRGGYTTVSTTPIPLPDLSTPPKALLNPTAVLAPFALHGDGDYDHALYYGDDPGASTRSYRAALQRGGGAWSSLAETLHEDGEQEPAIVGALTAVLASNTVPASLSFTLSADAVEQWRRAPRDVVNVLLGNEWLVCSGWSLAANVLTTTSVQRAAFDTVPFRHAAGTSARILLGFVVSTDRLTTLPATGLAPLAGVAALRIRAESRGPAGVLEAGNASTSQASISGGSTQGRAPRPLPPGNVRLGGVVGVFSAADAVPSSAAGTSLALSWSNRNRATRAVASWFDTTNDVELNTRVTALLEYENTPGSWVSLGWTIGAVEASSMSLATSSMPAGKRVRVLLKSYRTVAGVNIESFAQQLFWQL